jgi:hypothetical protein
MDTFKPFNFKSFNLFYLEYCVKFQIFNSKYWACYMLKNLNLKCYVGNILRYIPCIFTNLIQYKFLGEFFFSRKFFKYKQLQPRNSKIVVKKKKNRQLNKLKLKLNKT